MVERYPNLKEEVGGSIPGCEISSQISKKKLAVQFLALKSPLYLMENLPGGQLLLCFGVGLSAFYLKKEKKDSDAP